MPSRVIKGVFSALLLSSTLLTALPASAAARVYVRVGPPAPVVDVRPVAPGARYVWINGYHRWDGHAYAWVPGRWELPPRARAAWVGGPMGPFEPRLVLRRRSLAAISETIRGSADHRVPRAVRPSALQFLV